MALPLSHPLQNSGGPGTRSGSNPVPLRASRSAHLVFSAQVWTLTMDRRNGAPVCQDSDTQPGSGEGRVLNLELRQRFSFSRFVFPSCVFEMAGEKGWKSDYTCRTPSTGQFLGAQSSRRESREDTWKCSLAEGYCHRSDVTHQPGKPKPCVVSFRKSPSFCPCFFSSFILSFSFLFSFS